MKKSTFFKRLIDLEIMNENGGISLRTKDVKDWPPELDIENWEIDSVSPGDEDDEKGEGYVSGYAGGDWQDMTRFTILIPASGKPYCKLFDDPSCFSGKNIYKELKSLVKKELKENKMKGSLAELQLVRAKRRYEAASKALEEAREGFRQEAKKVLKEQRIKQTITNTIGKDEVVEAVKTAYEQVFKDAIAEKISKLNTSTGADKKSTVIEIIVDGRDVGNKKVSFKAKCSLINSDREYEIVPEDETLDMFRGSKADLKKDVKDFVKDVYKKAETSKIVKALIEE